MGKTLLLLELAARIVRRYERNVFFYSVQNPSVYIAKKASLRNDTRFVFAEEPGTGEFDRYFENNLPAIHLLDSHTAELDRACETASGLRNTESLGCAAFVVDGWTTMPMRPIGRDVVDGVSHYSADRWPHEPISREILVNLKRFSLATKMPVCLGVTTASVIDEEALAESFELETQLRVGADRLVSLHRPEIYVDTELVRPEDRNVVCLSGKSLRWWDTRCSKLRFDPRRLRFQTVV